MTPGLARGHRTRRDATWVRAGGVLAAWILLVLGEDLFVAIAHSGDLAGAWEAKEVRRWASPIAVASLIPLAFVTVFAARALARRRVAATVLAFGAGLTAWGCSNGRHFASPAVRVPFVLATAGGAGLLAWLITPLIFEAATVRPRVLALCGVAASLLAWSADLLVLPRLYPAFHAALFTATLAGSALLSLAIRPAPDERTHAPAVIGAIALVVGGVCVAWTPAAAHLLASADNVRIVLAEHAPVLGRAVWLATRLAPPPELTDDTTAASTATGDLPRSLDWTGRDIVLITVDALRADHVSVYGYPRATTPNLDALAKEGARFDAAYCPTPHTSYSIASLMTGKYMRPLVALGLGDDSDTWAGLLRRYGYRTAAFYPPAVFFIDGDRFEAMHAHGLDFEYRKEEFATPELRAKQVGEYLSSAPHDKPLFLWVHFFEPHEPYVAHPEHPFGDADIDRYDSEIAAADDGIGSIVREVRASRPGAVVIATADHGEEFGEHGGRYHGTTVYEEQVRVPLVVAGPGVKPGDVKSVAQTIDLLPTTLSAIGIPRPARLRGRDLGPALAGKGTSEPGLAFAETDEYTLLARGDERLVCERRVAACALYDRATDPGEKHDVAGERAPDVRSMKHAMVAIASEHGRFERGEEAAWPEALRRGLAGDADAAQDVAALLDDASPAIRAEAARVTFDLHAPGTLAQVKRAANDTSQEDTVRRFAALTLVRLGEPATPLAEAMLRDPDAEWRRRAGLAFAERGDARGAVDLRAWWVDRSHESYVRGTEILAALVKIHDSASTAMLARSLEDVRMRPYVADALAAIGGTSAREALSAALASETQVTSLTREARALAALGGASWSASPPVARADARLGDRLGRAASGPDGPAPARLVVLLAGPGPCEVSVDGRPLTSEDSAEAHTYDLDLRGTPALRVVASSPSGISALFLARKQARADAGAP
jgi:arylsulfatase A-like enzyme